MQLEPVESDLREICRHIVEEFDAPVELTVEGDVTGTWDEDRVAEVLSNVLGNAIEHAAPGTAAIVRARSDGAHVIVEITNRGDAIPADALAFIFEPFHRAREHTGSKTDHLGLGLYIARRLVVAHGGTLTAQSTDGETTFAMRLPRRPAPSAA